MQALQELSGRVVCLFFRHGEFFLGLTGATFEYLYLTRHISYLNDSEEVCQLIQEKVNEYKARYPARKKIVIIIPGTGHLSWAEKFGYVFRRKVTNFLVQNSIKNANAKAFFGNSFEIKKLATQIHMNGVVYDEVYGFWAPGWINQHVREISGASLAQALFKIHQEHPEGIDVTILAHSYGSAIPLEMERYYAQQIFVNGDAIIPIDNLFMYALPVGVNVMRLAGSPLSRIIFKSICMISVEGDTIQVKDFMEGKGWRGTLAAFPRTKEFAHIHRVKLKHINEHKIKEIFQKYKLSFGWDTHNYFYNTELSNLFYFFRVDNSMLRTPEKPIVISYIMRKFEENNDEDVLDLALLCDLEKQEIHQMVS